MKTLYGMEDQSDVGLSYRSQCGLGANRRWKLTKNLAVLLTVCAFNLPIALEAAGTMNVAFYGRDGALLTAAQVRSLSNNGNLGYNNDYLVDPTTLRAVVDAHVEGVLVHDQAAVLLVVFVPQRRG